MTQVRTADTARDRLAWILAFDRIAARKRRHDRRPIRREDAHVVLNVNLARFASRLFGGEP